MAPIKPPLQLDVLLTHNKSNTPNPISLFSALSISSCKSAQMQHIHTIHSDTFTGTQSSPLRHMSQVNTHIHSTNYASMTASTEVSLSPTCQSQPVIRTPTNYEVEQDSCTVQLTRDLLLQQRKCAEQGDTLIHTADTKRHTLKRKTRSFWVKNTNSNTHNTDNSGGKHIPKKLPNSRNSCYREKGCFESSHSAPPRGTPGIQTVKSSGGWNKVYFRFPRKKAGCNEHKHEEESDSTRLSMKHRAICRRNYRSGKALYKSAVLRRYGAGTHTPRGFLSKKLLYPWKAAPSREAKRLGGEVDAQVELCPQHTNTAREIIHSNSKMHTKADRRRRQY